MMVTDAAALPTTGSPSDITVQLRRCSNGLQQEQLLQLSSKALASGYGLTAALAMEQLRGQMQQAEAWLWARQCSGATTNVEPYFKSLGLPPAECKIFASHELGCFATTDLLGFHDPAPLLKGAAAPRALAPCAVGSRKACLFCAAPLNHAIPLLQRCWRSAARLS